eukprot:scaffold264313_cov18-Tisochrysis_lutea.AAC.1
MHVRGGTMPKHVAELDCFERKSSFPAGASFPPARPEEHAKSSGQAEHYQKRTSYSRDFLLKFQKVSRADEEIDPTIQALPLADFVILWTKMFKLGDLTLT